MTFINNFHQRINAIHRTLSQISPETAKQPVASGKWSPLQIMGHLIDSANNNHRRFTKAQWQDNLVFDGYAQAEWVAVNHYQTANWQQILDLWRLYNLQICHLMAHTPLEKLQRTTTDHNFHQIAMVTIPEGEPTTLQYFMEDYIYHIDHHFRQIQAVVGS